MAVFILISTLTDYYIPFLRYIGKHNVIESVGTQLLNTDRDTIFYRNKGYIEFDKKWNASVDRLLATGEKYKINFNKETLILFE